MLLVVRLPPLLSSSATLDAKPRVLLADDHPQMLDSMSAMLADDFNIVGLAGDGEQALEAADHADADLIVLDVAMPGLDGFKVCRALEGRGSRARVVFLSMHAADEYVGEAFGAGGRGYVLKTRATQDLASALDHVLAGRVFLPSLTSLFHVAGDGRGHAMQVHGDEADFLDGTAAFFDLALQRGDATCLIGTTSVREGIADRLRARGWDINGSAGHPRIRIIDAEDALGRFMRNGLPDASQVAEIADELDQYRLATAEGPSSRLTIFGNMVVPLVMGGNGTAAVALERLWNMLTHSLPFFTLCGYSQSCFANGHAHDLFDSTCGEHWAVSHAPGL
jgi:CheY-like chemotaxis protein